MPSSHVSAPLAPDPQHVVVAGCLPDAARVALEQWARGHELRLVDADLPLDGQAVRRLPPAMVVLGVDGVSGDGVVVAIDALKRDGRLQAIPLVACTTGEPTVWLDAGADEVLTDRMTAPELAARLVATWRRSRRDLQVNPSTKLAGADALAAAMALRIERGELFGACYADLDHFKEFNDRYGYAQGDDVIRAVAALIVEVVEAAAGDRGFVGHIGGDDFLFLVPLDCVAPACDLLVQRADEILPARYSAHDRQAGYFFGKDRRGRLDRVSLMTLSVGVVTNARRRFTSAAQVSELATEMKTYAKTLPGSVWAMDRRSDGESATPPEEKFQ